VGYGTDFIFLTYRLTSLQVTKKADTHLA